MDNVMGLQERIDLITSDSNEQNDQVFDKIIYFLCLDIVYHYFKIDL